MAKLIYSAITSLDGYVADEDGVPLPRSAPADLVEMHARNVEMQLDELLPLDVGA